MGHRLSEEERQRILLTCNQPEYAALPPGQIVPALADQKLFYSCGEDFVYGSESSFYRVLHRAGSVTAAGGPGYRRSRARCRASGADGPNQVWSWDITNLPTTVRCVWLYLHLVVDV